MNKPKLKTVLITSILLAFVAAGGWVWQKNNHQKIVSSQLATSGPEISVSIKDDMQVVKNNYSDVQVKVPKNWKVFYNMPEGEKIQIMKAGPGQPQIDTDWVDGLKLQVYVEDNLDSLSIEDWGKKNWAFTRVELASLPRLEVNNIPIIKSTQFFSAEDDFTPTAILSLSMVWQKKYYDFHCTVVGDSAQIVGYLKECENLIVINIQSEFK